MEKKPHFSALMTYFTAENGGIITPVSSGFRSVIRFPHNSKAFIANQTFTETEIVFPGDTVCADIYLLEAGEDLEKIYEGLDFDILTNSNPIGSGIIKRIYPLEDTSL